MDKDKAGLLRAMAFFDVVDYAPTKVELICHSEGGGSSIIDEFECEGIITQNRGRYFFVGREHLVREHEKREALFSRKLRRAQKVVRWLRRLSGVKFVALCNTTALAHAGEKGDLDFFIVAKKGALWQTRGWSTLPLQLLKARPGEVESDAVCLSFFIDDSALNLSPLQLGTDDVYFRHWFLSLLPLYDEGMSRFLWDANKEILARHPHAVPWIVNQDIGFEKVLIRLPMLTRFENTAQSLQRKRFSQAIRSFMNQDTRVVVDDHVLKFHVEDGRERVRSKYQAACSKYGIDP